MKKSIKKKIKKAIFIAPYPKSAKIIMEASHYPPMGLAYTSGFLEPHGIECKIVDANLFKLDENEVFKIIKDFDPDLVGISYNVVTVHEAINISKMVKEQLGKRVLLGGPSSAGNPKYILENSKADCVVRGEGEVVTLNLIKNNFDLKGIKGILYLKGNRLIQNPPQPVIEDINTIPFPAWHLLPKLSLYKNRSRRYPIAPMVTSRGCPYACTFCGSAKTGWRYRSAKNIVAEIELLVNKYGVKQIDVLDDNFTLLERRAHEVLDLILEKKLNILITFPNGLRADRLTPELIKKMKKAGVYRTGIGIETGDERVMKNIKKYLELDRVRESIKLLRKEGIVVFGYFLLGLPGDTKESMQKTIDFAREVNPHWANFGVTTPLPGTELYRDLIKAGKIKEGEDDSISSGYYAIKEGYLTTDEVTNEEIMIYQKKAWREFYFRPSKVIDLLSTIRSWREFEWTVLLAWPIFKGLIVKKSN